MSGIILTFPILAGKMEAWRRFSWTAPGDLWACLSRVCDEHHLVNYIGPQGTAFLS